MGSLMRDPGRWILVENPSSPLPHPLPSHLIPFHQRQNNNRSPLHSPPILKKLPKVKAGNTFGLIPAVELPSSYNTTLSSSPVHLELTGDRERTSILRSGPKTRGSTRRVNFDPEVVVHRFDVDDGRHVSSEGQRLGSDQKDRKEFLERNIRGAGHRTPRSFPVDATFSPAAGLSLPGRRGVGVIGGGEPPIRYAVPLPAVTSSPPVAMTSQSPNQKDVFADRRVQGRSSSSSSSSYSSSVSETKPRVDFSFFEDDESHQLHLRLSVSLGEGVEAGDILVKANTVGNRVRVVGTRTGTSSGTPQEFAERYQLPMEVDPYRIRARMDGSGRLYLEAPVLSSGDRRRALGGSDGPGFDSGFSDFVR